MSTTATSLTVDLDGVLFPTPVLAASGCFGSGKEMSEIIDVHRLGGIVTKSVTLNGKLRIRERRLLPLRQLQHYAFRSQTQRPADRSRFQVESGAERSTHGAEVGQL